MKPTICQISPEEIDQHLPQTQCGLCTFGGCLPYAEAIVFEQAPINLCPPGGVSTLQTLGELLQQEVTPFLSEMEKKAKPKMIALIRENECIGCTKCIQACPIDAILGSAKQMHTVIANECSGCELCIAPCPVDCIEMVTLPDLTLTLENTKQYRKRYYARQQRVSKATALKKISAPHLSLTKKKNYIQAAIDRVKMKKNLNKV